ncbi:class A beta-lactamase-related serine hydrolase [Lactobacillus xujianguonis]|uniref:Class A beta-lactamase-related serine hydrolase n=1 Tax=Lactobacillus xujianguonis TaxID=2495899 RepID=A0A437SW64_9LACO|nr:class A beta-lactamase-related serine hydrolase [Lactobacillus xujianguonis]RVU77524.1 class A beta-lactamase-related serine hydrolase [Lactobacillus xujianguonis]
MIGAAFCASLFCCAGSRSQTVKAEVTSSFVKKALTEAHIKGSVVVVQDGKAKTVNVGYGYYKRKLDNGSSKLVYPLGSLQKAVTGAMITQLIYQGKLSQNTKISRWYPLLKHAKHITVGQLMTHTSGLNMSGSEQSHGIKFSEAGAIKWTVAKLDLTPRSKVNDFNYSNANYVLLAGIIRKVTHKSYAANVKSRIIKPLKLHHTYIYKDIPRRKTDAISYYGSHKGNYRDPLYANQYTVTQLPGAGNLFSQPGDYLKIIKGLSNGKILTEKQYHYMTHLKSKKSTYSGGLYLKKHGDLQVAYGNFGGTHFSNWIQLTSDNKNGIVLFSNQTQNNKNKNRAVGYKILNKIKKNTFVKR